MAREPGERTRIVLVIDVVGKRRRQMLGTRDPVNTEVRPSDL